MFGYSKLLMTTAILAGVLGVGATGAALAATGSEQAEIAGVQAAQVAPVAAIKAAEAKTGGRAVDFGLEKNATTNAYEVTIATGTGLSKVQVDPVSGAVTGSTAQPADALAGDGLPANRVGQAAAAPVSLDQAVATAEQAGGGRALEANYVVRQGHTLVDVDVVKSGATRAYTVDAANGHVVPAQAAEAGEGGQDRDGALGQHQGDGDGEQDND